MARLVIGALVAGILVFAWGAVSHMVLPLGRTSVKRLPEEAALVDLLRRSVREPGVYLYPGIDMEGEPSEEEEAAWKAAYELGPRGLVVFHPGGTEPMSPRFLAIELASNVLAALLAAVVLSVAAAGFLGRVLIVTTMGLFAWVSVDLSFWNWYGFPPDFVLAEAVDQVGGWLLGGVALAAIVRKERART